jgi:ribosomal protein S18 acetylase RimI-like enzyme
MTDLTLRRATAADERALAVLAARLTAFELPSWRAPRDISEADARAMLAAVVSGDPDDEVLIAERAGEVVGCLHVLAVTDFFGLRHGHVSVIATTEAAEGSGVARLLIEHAEQWTAERGLPLLTLNMFAGNARARGFYEKGGFQIEMVKYAKPVNYQPPTSKDQGTPNSQSPNETPNS